MGWTAQEDELLPKRLALPVFASDALSSVAYATEAALVVLLTASLAAYDTMIPISIAIAVLMAIVVLSYRQTILAYPRGGGAFTVASDNLGRAAGLVAAAALAVDYLLTATVSVAAAVLAVTSAMPRLDAVTLELALACIASLALINLRGLRQAGRAVVIPVYGFVAMVILTLIVGLVAEARGTLGTAQVDDALPIGTAASATLLVVLRAFASGSSALTGIESVANGVGAFRHPQGRNAATTLVVMGATAVTLLLGVSWLARAVDARPSQSTSVLSQIGDVVWGSHGVGSVGFYVLQFFTFSILLLAANTAYQGFPRLLASVAATGQAPRWFQYVGDRLVFTNGVLALSVLAAVLIAAFDVRVDLLIHLYLLGVFLAFTLSQSGMVVYWWRRRSTARMVIPSMTVNAVGALATAVVLAVIMATKFSDGAWLVMVVIPLLAALAYAVGTHYRAVEHAIREPSYATLPPPVPGSILVLVDRIDERTACAARAGTVLAGQRGRRAVYVGGRDRWQSVSRAWRREESLHIPLTPLPGVYGEGPDAIAAHLRAIADGDGSPCVAVLPRVPLRPRPKAVRRWLLWRRLRRRLEREPMVAVTELSHVTSGGWWQAERVVSMVAVARPYAPAQRAIAFAEGFDPDAAWAVHVAGSEREAEAAEQWREEIPVPLEVVESAYRDLGVPVQAAVRDAVNADASTICVLIVPEVVVNRRWFRWLHNQRTAILRRALGEEERTMLMTLPYPVDV